MLTRVKSRYFLLDQGLDSIHAVGIKHHQQWLVFSQRYSITKTDFI